MSMEQVSVPIGTFEAITLQDSTFTAIYKQLRDILSIRSWRNQLRILWVILSTLFIVAFPSLASAMTGYAPVTSAFVQAPDGQLVPFTSCLPIRYIVHDADRLGLDKPLILTDVVEDSTCKWQCRSLQHLSDLTDLRRDESDESIAFNINGRGDICAEEENIPFQFTDDGPVTDWSNMDERCLLIWHVRECKRCTFHQLKPYSLACRCRSIWSSRTE